VETRANASGLILQARKAASSGLLETRKRDVLAGTGQFPQESMSTTNRRQTFTSYGIVTYVVLKQHQALARRWVVSPT